jgi:hypothetical protein
MVVIFYKHQTNFQMLFLKPLDGKVLQNGGKVIVPSIRMGKLLTDFIKIILVLNFMIFPS